MEETRKQILDKFQEHVEQSFKIYCERHGKSYTGNQIIPFLIDFDLIPVANIKKYVVLKEFEIISSSKDLRKTEIVGMLANRFNISERTVWNILKQVRLKRKSLRLS
jgi:hypothetical protein